MKVEVIDHIGIDDDGTLRMVKLRIAAPQFVERQMRQRHAACGAAGLAVFSDARDVIRFYAPPVWRDAAGEPVGMLRLSDGVTGHFAIEADEAYALFTDSAGRLHDALIKAGVDPEQARIVLPPGRFASWVWTGTLPFFACVCDLRGDLLACWETHRLCILIDEELSRRFPDGKVSLADA